MLRLGYFLEMVGVMNHQFPSVPYRGVDRLWFVPVFDGKRDEVANLRATGRTRLADLWDAYLDAKLDDRLEADGRLAEALRRGFAAEGVALDLVYIEVAACPTDLGAYPRGQQWADKLGRVLAYWTQRQAAIPERPSDARLLGYDLSHPTPSFHSAIFQPGLRASYPDLPESLNDEGLLDSIDEAERLLPIANALDYGTLPFCILGVWALP